MQIYTVESITEADYGCEETGRKEPTALLKLIEDAPDPEEKYVEVTEATLAKQKISEGKKVCFTKDGNILKYIRVVAAVIRDDERIFATARGYGEYKGWWEFPGGKIEKGETPQQALVREIKEELTADIKVGEIIHTIEYDYPEFHLSMDCFWAEVTGGQLVLKEAEAARWLGKNELDSVKWLPADLELVGKIKNP
ncbi:MAG: (deoxy)nucleoside triphosphate pyrophosphohydrolase [Lachnospiraceae bacterium]|nr:(deoxy)nucleoside triphosphate pyrophosphohydrolase [Lachnospiraceae bacterium]